MKLQTLKALSLEGQVFYAQNHYKRKKSRKVERQYLIFCNADVILVNNYVDCISVTIFCSHNRIVL